MRLLIRWLLIPCLLFLMTLYMCRSNDTKSYQRKVKHFVRNISENSCAARLQKRILPMSVLLIDLDYLKGFNEKPCAWNESKPIKIGIDAKYKSKKLQLKNFKVYYYINNSRKDFFSFDMDGVRRLIPRRFDTKWIGKIEIPVDVERFEEFWKRSKFIDCLGLDMHRNMAEKPYSDALPTVDILARLRDDLLDSGMFPSLNSGTFLGWYRECTVIPHTTDLDIAVSKDKFNPEYIEKTLNGESEFRLIRKLGKIEDSFELTVTSRKKFFFQSGTNIDIFIMYEFIEDGALKYYYISGLAGDGTKYRYTYPIYDPWCVGEMHDHFFWVPCSPETLIPAEYGPNWHLDHPSSEYSWNSSPFNVKEAGKFTEEELKKYYVTY